ncbi:MAG: hypothetical protein ACT4QF_07375 [Sporichthyaceae bacterium]
MRSLRVRFGAACAALAVVVGGAAIGGAAQAVDVVEAAPPATKPTVTKVRIGPFVLPPAPAGAMHGQNRFVPTIAKPCEDCYVTSVTPDLVMADGSRADMNDGVMLHHMVIFEPGKTDPTCGRSQGVGALGRRIFAAGDERTSIALPAGFGFKVDPGRWTGIAELMNHSAQAQTVYLTVDVAHVPANTPGMKPVTPVWLDVANCSDSQYRVPAGRSATPWTWTSTMTGRIVAGGGHVHAGGIGLTLDNATSKQRICASRAGYGTDALAGMVTSMSTCEWDSLGTVRRGETLRMTSLYDAPRELGGVMGIMLIAVYETDDLAGGTKAPAAMKRTPTTKVPAKIADDSGHGAGGHEGGGHEGHGAGEAQPPHHWRG